MHNLLAAEFVLTILALLGIYSPLYRHWLPPLQDSWWVWAWLGKENRKAQKKQEH